MNKALYPRDDVHRLYVSRNEGGRGLSSFQDSIQTLEDYAKSAEED